MPLKLKPPRAGRTPFYQVRGTHLGYYLDRSTGTADRRVAAALRRKWCAEIESRAASPRGALLFTEAALAYVRAGGEATYLRPLANHFASSTIDDIDQVAVDLAAVTLYPAASPATRNRQVYTPVSAILNHARPNRLTRFRRPKNGPQRTHWLTPDQAKILVANLDPRLQALAVFLLYSGCRLGEALNLQWQTVDLKRRVAVIEVTKNGDPRAVKLTRRVVVELAALTPLDGSAPVGRVFGFTHRYTVGHLWKRGAIKAGLPWATPHILRHTWGTWMRLYAKVDAIGLVNTKAWKDLKSVQRYMHVAPTVDAARVDALPGSKR